MDQIVGRIPVLDCLRAKKRAARRLLVASGITDLDEIIEAATAVEVKECPRQQLDAMTDGLPHQGVLLEAEPLPVRNADEWVQQTFDPDAVVVVLDGIEDPRNFGAIVRSAAACGACAVVFGKDRAAPVSPVSAKSAAGAMEWIELVRATNLVRAIQGLKKAGFWVAALDPDGPQVLWEAPLTGRTALVIGGEGKGIRRLVLETCDLRVRIPLTPPITSLNASVSAAVALVECRRQRAQSPRAHET